MSEWGGVFLGSGILVPLRVPSTCFQISGFVRVRPARQEGTSRSPFEFKCFHYYYKWGRFGAVAMVIAFSLYVEELFWLCFECKPEIESKDKSEGVKSVHGGRGAVWHDYNKKYLCVCEAVKLQRLKFHDFTWKKTFSLVEI